MQYWSCLGCMEAVGVVHTSSVLWIQCCGQIQPLSRSPTSRALLGKCCPVHTYLPFFSAAFSSPLLFFSLSSSPKFSSFFVPLSFLSIGPGSRSLLCPKLVSFFTLKVPQLQDRLSLFFRSPREPYVPRPQSFHQCRSTGHITARRNIDQASIA